jgi:hypothetical protein
MKKADGPSAPHLGEDVPMDGNKGNFIWVRELLLHAAFAAIGSSILAIFVIWLISLLHLQPNFLSEIVIYVAAGFPVGYCMNSRFPSRFGPLAWTLLFLWMLVSMTDFARPGHVDWHQIWVSFFTSRCSDSECLYELLSTLPFFGSAGYSFGAWLVLRHGLRWPTAGQSMRPGGK